MLDLFNDFNIDEIFKNINQSVEMLYKVCEMSNVDVGIYISIIYDVNFKYLVFFKL